MVIIVNNQYMKFLAKHVQLNPAICDIQVSPDLNLATKDAVWSSTPSAETDQGLTWYITLSESNWSHCIWPVGFPFIWNCRAILQCMGEDKAEAVSEEVWMSLIADGKLEIIEHGPGMLAIMTVLTKYLEKYPNHGKLLKWLEDLISAAKTVMKVSLVNLHSTWT